MTITVNRAFFLFGKYAKDFLEYLKTTFFSIELIAKYVGFSSTSQFYCTFKKYYHITPYEYRKKNSNRGTSNNTSLIKDGIIFYTQTYARIYQGVDINQSTLLSYFYTPIYFHSLRVCINQTVLLPMIQNSFSTAF